MKLEELKKTNSVLEQEREAPLIPYPWLHNRIICSTTIPHRRASRPIHWYRERVYPSAVDEPAMAGHVALA
jgi:hypothetical protein